MFIRVADEEAANAPRLKGQGVGNLRACLDRRRVAGVVHVQVNASLSA